MSDKFFLDYINFIGMLKLMGFFLYEGVKAIYRFAYGIISICPFKIVKEHKPEEKQQNENQLQPTLSLLSEQITLEYDFDVRPEAEVLRLYKDVSNKLGNWNFFFDSINQWDLAHRNNGFVSLKLPSALKEQFPLSKKLNFILPFSPNLKS